VKTKTRSVVREKINQRAHKRSGLTCAVVALSATMAASSAQAISFDTGNRDLSVRWDNTFRYNAGWRLEDQNQDFIDSPFYDDGENSFEQGDMVINRLDILSELDVVWKGQHALRISAAGWYDDVYQDDVTPRSNASGNYIDNEYNSYADRYMAGPSGEILDAFVQSSFYVGQVSGTVRAGQHNVYWGESLYSIGNSIAYSQGPVDTIKSAVSPGAEAKELFLPLTQVSAQFQLTSDLSLGAQYLLDWEPFRLVPGGTYFAGSDGSRSDFGAAPEVFPIRNGSDFGPDDDHGDFGISLRWSPWWLQGTAGIYYRRFDEKLPWSFTQVGIVEVAPGNFQGVPQKIRLGYARDTELYGVSLTKTVGTSSVGAEISYRKDTALNSVSGYTVIPANNAEPTYEEMEGARGNTFHALVNSVYLLPETPLWVGGTLQGELSYNYLDKITENEDRFNGRGDGCTTAYSKNCVDDHSLGIQIVFTPEWPQAFAGWDMSMPTSLAYGLDGNSPTLGGTNEGVYNYSIGVAADYQSKHFFTAEWIDSHGEYEVNPASGYVTSDHTVGSPVQNDHGWLSFTYKVTL
jgi:Protein of unknown function (DUF1302)